MSPHGHPEYRGCCSDCGQPFQTQREIKKMYDDFCMPEHPWVDVVRSPKHIGPGPELPSALAGFDNWWCGGRVTVGAEEL